MPSDLREQVHLNTAQQNVVNGKHVIRINISPDAYLFFSKEYGQLKAWMYSWHYASDDHKAVTGQLLSYSFQDSKLYGLVYKNNIITRWGYLETGLPKIVQSNKKTQSIFGAGFFKALWCVMTGRDWNDQTKIDGRCAEGSAIGTAIETVVSFISNLFDDSPGSGGSGGEFSGGFVLFNGAPPTLPQPENGANVGDPNTTQNYMEGYPYVAVWVPAQPDAGCPTTSPNGDQQPIGTIDDSPTGPNCNTQGHWVSVAINENNVTAKLITRLGITDANKQSFLYNNTDIAGELYLYLLQSNNTQDDIDTVNWAVEYLMENPSTDFAQFYKQFLTSFYPSTFRNISDNETAVNPLTGQTITFGEVRALFENTSGLIDAIESGNETSIFPSIIVWPTLQSIECEYELAVLSKLHPEWSKTRLFATALWNVWKDEYHFMLDVAGMFPVIGEAADLINGGIYYLEGDYINCAWSVSSAVPITGWVSTGAKWVKRARKAIPASSIPAGAKAFRAIKSAKGAVRLVRLPVSTFAHSAINALQAIKPADNTLTNISATIVDQFSHRVKPVIQSLKNKIDDIVLHGDATGVKTEELADELFTTNGFNKYEGRFGSNNGFDGIYIKKDASGHVQEIIINEAKQVKPQGNIQMGTTSSKGPQLSERWINETILEMRTNGNQAIQNLGNLLDANRVLITKTVTAVDKSNSEIVILRLTNY